jgi:hypothetical protein
MANPRELIKGKVAQVLNLRELVINRGASDGVEIGMRFAVLNRRGADITDPDTGEQLGSVEVEKTIVKVVRIKEHLAVGRTFRTFSNPGKGIAALQSSLLGKPASLEVETLESASGVYKEEIDEEDSYISIGDPVVQVVADEFLTD